MAVAGLENIQGLEGLRKSLPHDMLWLEAFGNYDFGMMEGRREGGTSVAIAF